MIRLVVIEGSAPWSQAVVEPGGVVLGRSPGEGVSLPGSNVSRRHSRVWREGEQVFIEDLKSSNGTFVNSRKIQERTPLFSGDIIRIGSHALRVESSRPGEADITIQRQTMADSANMELFRENPAGKLKIILELSHHLANALDTESLLARLLEHLLLLFPHAARALVVFPGPAEPVVRALKARKKGGGEAHGFSRTVVRQVMEKGVAVLAEDTTVIDAGQTIAALGIRSLICVPLRTKAGGNLGVVQLDRFDLDHPFVAEDLNLLAAIALQASALLENTALHQEVLAAHRMKSELALAREIQIGFLPKEPPVLPAGGLDWCGALYSANEVSGDFYDYIVLDDRRVAMVVADVSGKGMPAALFLSMVRALVRELAGTISSPAHILSRVNKAITRDNPKSMFVTMILGVYDVVTGDYVMSRAGHPPAILRRKDGSIGEIAAPSGVLLGIDPDCTALSDTTVTLEPGDTVLFYTDGVTEASGGGELDFFGTERLLRTMARMYAGQCLEDWTLLLRREIQTFSKSSDLGDDVTLLLVRRTKSSPGPGGLRQGA